jgi:hypothetical protein
VPLSKYPLRHPLVGAVALLVAALLALAALSSRPQPAIASQVASSVIYFIDCVACDGSVVSYDARTGERLGVLYEVEHNASATTVVAGPDRQRVCRP